MGIIVALILALSASKNGGIDPTGGFTKNQETTVNVNRNGGIDPTGGFTSKQATQEKSYAGGIDPTGG